MEHLPEFLDEYSNEEQFGEIDKPCYDAEETDSGDTPNVFVYFTNENNQHVEHVNEFVNSLRNIGINATSELHDSIPKQNKPFYLITSIAKADFVLVVCSKTMKYVDSHMKGKRNKKTPGEFNTTLFMWRQILNDIYSKHGLNNKYIPVMLAHCKRKYIPKSLRHTRTFKLPDDLEDLVYRLQNTNKYVLATPRHDHLTDIFQQNSL